MRSAFVALTVFIFVGCSSKAGNHAASNDDAGGATPVANAGGDDDGTPTTPGELGDDGGPALGAPAPTSDDDAAAPGDDASGDDDAAPTPTDGGSQLANTDAAPAPTSSGVFADAGAYVATLGPTSLNAKHTPTTNPAGQDCLTCHGGQAGIGKGKPPVEFLFAGTVWSSAAATTPVPMAEIRVVQSDGTALSAYSDAEGNFYFTKAKLPALSPPVMGGARDGTSEQTMTNVFTVGACNSCHKAGGEAPIHLP